MTFEDIVAVLEHAFKLELKVVEEDDIDTVFSINDYLNG